MKIHHICIQTDNYEQSLEFYKNILKFKIVQQTPAFHGRLFNSWLQLDDFMIELQTAKGNEELRDFNKLTKAIVHFCLTTENIEKEYERIHATGFRNFLPKNGDDLYSVEGGKLFKITAPEGTIIEIRDLKEI